MNQADALVARLDGVMGHGPTWRARCPAHVSKEKHRSLGVRELEDGRVLVRCHAGCPAVDILAAVGLELRDLFPAGPHGAYLPPVHRKHRSQESEYMIPGARAVTRRLQESRARCDVLLRRVAILSGINVSPSRPQRGRHRLTTIFATDDPSAVAMAREASARVPQPKDANHRRG